MMMPLIIIVIIVLLIVFLLVILKSKNANQQSTKYETQTQQQAQTFHDEEIESSLAEINEEVSQVEYIRAAYAHKWMFTQNEKRAYYQLNKIAVKHNLILFAKVRLFDLVTPQRNHPKYKTNLYKIQAKHVDFVLTKSNLVAKYVIELDDSSHDRPDRKARDNFVDIVLQSCGYKVLHVREINEDEIEKFLVS